jgi:hypothetical protein
MNRHARTAYPPGRLRVAILIGCLVSIAAGYAGSALAGTAEQTPPNASAPAQPTAPPACTTAENRQFDFWIGHWRVVNTTDRLPAGESRIERLYAGCTIRENWVEPGYSGGSLNTYVAADRHWHQTWTDSTGSWREFVGGLVDGRMVLVWSHPSVRLPGRTASERMIFTRNPDGSVRQYSDQSSDGVTWVQRYDYTYLPIHD